jgi:hypothetical protein
MFGRYPLSLKRKVVGIVLVVVFVLGLYNYVGLYIYTQLHPTGDTLDPFDCPWPSPRPSDYVALYDTCH